MGWAKGLYPLPGRRSPKTPTDVSVVIPVKDGADFLPACLESLLHQDFTGTWEVSIYNDGSTDETGSIIERFAPQFKSRGIGFIRNDGRSPGGVGFAKNMAVMASSGFYLCFCDADDTSSPSRISLQFEAAERKVAETDNGYVLFGSRFDREPADSTGRYSRWANNLTPSELYSQIYTSHGPTLIAPTWFVSKALFDRLGGFAEIRQGYPEDLGFFFRALAVDATLEKVDASLVTYRYHPECASFGVSEDTIWDMRMKHLSERVLPKWDTFTIWNAGKQGKKFFKSLSQEEQNKVVAFCDVDDKKIKHGCYEPYDEAQRRVTHRIPISHVRDASPPLVVCVKLDMTDGELETLMAQSGWREGTDYVLFS